MLFENFHVDIIIYLSMAILVLLLIFSENMAMFDRCQILKNSFKKIKKVVDACCIYLLTFAVLLATFLP